jgi:hypothetical protein
MLRLLRMAQCASGDPISIALIYEELDPLSDRGF